MIAKVRRRATSSANGERKGVSVWRAKSDISERVAGKTRRIKGIYNGCGPAFAASYIRRKDDLPSACFDRA
ncbi:MAG: hypothetical protein NTAFB05_09040 [Nitrobacter sp.]